MKLSQKLLGSVTFEVIGGRTERFLNQCTQNGVPLQQVHATALGCTACVPLRYYMRLHRMARRQRCRLRVRRKEGAFFMLWPFRARVGIVAGLLAALALLLVCPRLVWTVQFYDFTYEEQTLLRKQLYDYGVCEGSMPTEAELIALQQTLFIENTAYSWVKLNFVNGKLVAEKVDAVPPPEMVETTPATIVARCDGIIERVEVDGGFIEKREGQSVAEGDVIISAVMVGRRGKLHTQRASAHVYAQVERTYEVTQPLTVDTAVQSTKSANQYAVHIFGKTFALPFQDKLPEGAQVTVLRSPLTFFGLPLPATVVRTQCRTQRETQVVLTPEQATDIARNKIYDAIAADLPECEMRDREEQVETTDTGVRMRMKITARADIAQVVENWNA